MIEILAIITVQSFQGLSVMSHKIMAHLYESYNYDGPGLRTGLYNRIHTNQDHLRILNVQTRNILVFY